MTETTTLDNSSQRPPSPRGPRAVGNLFNFERNKPTYVLNLAREFGGLVRIRSLVSDDYVVMDPAFFQHILVDHPERYDKQGFDYRSVGTAFGRGFGVAEGTEWNGLHNLAPLLRRSRVMDTATTILSHTVSMVDKWEAIAARSEVVDLKSEIRRLTFGIANEVMFGDDYAGEVDWMLTAFDMLNERGDFAQHPLSQAWYWLPTPANRRFHSATRKLDAFITDRMAEARSALDGPTDQGNNATEHVPLLSQMLHWRGDDGKQLPEREVRDNVFNWLFDGTEATASTLIWTLWLLGSHPNAQDELRDEVVNAIGSEALALKDVERLRWTRACWQEAARIYPSNYFLSRRALVDDKVNGYHIPAGASLTLSVYAAHHNPQLWPSPASFDPNRFMPGQGRDRHRLAYMPFGGGKRQCIAAQFALLQAQLVLATLIPRIRLTASPGVTVGADPWTMLRPRGEFRLRLDPTSVPHKRSANIQCDSR